jgi:pantoate--beta-alanine ligase
VKIVSSIIEMQQVADELRRNGKRIGVVPTMGYLHDGHLSLIKIAKQHSDLVVTTIFVNPTQFAPNEDFNKYPRDLERDSKLADSAGTDILFTPSKEEMYPGGYVTFVEVENITSVLEGTVRPTHFRGVATIVAKLFNIVKPHVAVFGQKDAQQAIVVRRMVKDLNFDIDIIVAPIVREPDGLAMSSRNVYLSADDRKQSTVLNQSLQFAKKEIENGERDCKQLIYKMLTIITAKPFASIDYISIADAATLEELSTLQQGREILISLAVRFGSTRLIDNILLTI